MDQGPANTLNYMVAGYAVFFSVLIVYLVSLVIRWRNLRQDESILEQIEEEGDQGTKEMVTRPSERVS